MDENNDNRLNLFDYFGFPDRQQREEAQQICDTDRLHLIYIENDAVLFFDTFFKQYKAWSNHINNFSGNLWLHFLLMHYQFLNNPSDTITKDELHSPKIAHKIFFDTFAEDVSVYAISYFDKHLEMFNDLYDLKRLSRKKHNLSRGAIIEKMKKIDALGELANDYKIVEQSLPFSQVKSIRDNFVHNKSSSHYGRDVTKFAGVVYADTSSRGISTKETYSSICELLRSYEQLCEKVNAFINARLKMRKQGELRSNSCQPKDIQ